MLYHRPLLLTWFMPCPRAHINYEILVLNGWQAIQKVLHLSNLIVVLWIFYDANITPNMYPHGTTQAFQTPELLPNCMMICVSFSLRFCVKRLLNSSMSAKVNIGSYCKFYVCYTNWRNEVLLSGTESNKSIDNSTPVFGQMDSGDMLLLTWWRMLKIFWLDWWKWSNGVSARMLQTFTGLVWRCGVLPSETVDNGWTEN